MLRLASPSGSALPSRLCFHSERHCGGTETTEEAASCPDETPAAGRLILGSPAHPGGSQSVQCLLLFVSDLSALFRFEKKKKRRNLPFFANLFFFVI